MEGRVAALRAAGADLSPFEDPEVSGIAGTAFSAVFSYPAARRLAARHPQPGDRLGGLRRARTAPARWPAASSPCWKKTGRWKRTRRFCRWLEAARPRGRNGLRFLLERIAALPLDERDRGDLYDGLQLPLRWSFPDAARSRSRLTLDASARAVRSTATRSALIERRDVSLADHLQGPPLSIRRVPEREAEPRRWTSSSMLSAMRYRELYGFSHPDAGRVFHADAGRGLDMYFFGVPPAWRLPVRAYHGGMFFKNGVPAGYVEALSVFERAEVGFNLYYTFREGESAWIYARWLRLLRQALGVNTFSVDPYQIGHENEEAIQSGAFWFYRKLGFRPADPEIARRTEAEENRLRKTPGARSSAPTLRRLAAGCVLFEGPGSSPGAWDRFQVRNLGLAVARATAGRHGGDPARMAAWAAQRVGAALGAAPGSPLTLVASLIPALDRWPAADKTALLAILKAKNSGGESRYLRLMQRHARFRAACLKLGSEG